MIFFLQIFSFFFLTNIMNQKKGQFKKDVFESVMRLPVDPWASQVKSLIDKVGSHLCNGPKRFVKNNLRDSNANPK